MLMDQRRDEAAAPVNPDDCALVPTRALKQLRIGVEKAARERALVTAQGPVGIGKTTILRAEAARMKAAGHRVAFITASPDIGGNSAHVLNAAIIDVMGYTGGRMSETTRTFRDVFAVAGDDPDDMRSLVIIDEAQNLKPTVLETLRCRHDERRDGRGFGLVLSGNSGFVDRFGRGRTAAYAQFTSRIAARLTLEAPSETEIEMALHHTGAPVAADALAVLVKFGCAHGNFRAALMALTSAATAAAGRRIEVAHVRSAITLQEGIKA